MNLNPSPTTGHSAQAAFFNLRNAPTESASAKLTATPLFKSSFVDVLIGLGHQPAGNIGSSEEKDAPAPEHGSPDTQLAELVDAPLSRGPVWPGFVSKSSPLTGASSSVCASNTAKECPPISQVPFLAPPQSGSGLTTKASSQGPANKGGIDKSKLDHPTGTSSLSTENRADAPPTVASSFVNAGSAISDVSADISMGSIQKREVAGLPRNDANRPQASRVYGSLPSGLTKPEAQLPQIKTAVPGAVDRPEKQPAALKPAKETQPAGSLTASLHPVPLASAPFPISQGNGRPQMNALARVASEDQAVTGPAVQAASSADRRVDIESTKIQNSTPAHIFASLDTQLEVKVQPELAQVNRLRIDWPGSPVGVTGVEARSVLGRISANIHVTSHTAAQGITEELPALRDFARDHGAQSVGIMVDSQGSNNSGQHRGKEQDHPRNHAQSAPEEGNEEWSFVPSLNISAGSGLFGVTA